MSIRHKLNQLIPRRIVFPERTLWATVTQASPLRIKLDGESTERPFTPDSLVANLAISDRVRVAFVTNSNPNFGAERLIVLGRSGGPVATPAAHSATLITSGTLDSARLPAGTMIRLGYNKQGPGSSILAAGASTGYANLGSSFSTAINKHVAGSSLRITMNGTGFVSAAGVSASWGIRIGSTDYDVATVGQQSSLANAHGTFAGIADISGIAAGSVSIQARYKVTSGSLTMDSGDYLIIEVVEVLP